jgi:hypothetical protein
MTMSRAPRFLTIAAILLLGASAPAWADPPARVGRLSDVEGTVSFHTADQTDWSPATLNYPVTTGTSFWTEPNSRAEIQIGAAEVRLDQGSWADIVELDDSATQIRVNQGTVNVHVHAMPPGGVAVLTPKGQVDLLAPGSYDINAGVPNGDQPPAQMQLSVLEGSARFDGPRASVDVQAGEAAIIGGDPINVSLTEAQATPFDDWALAREHREAVSQAAQYVPPEMTGYQDLDAYGQWQSVPQYGEVWYPANVAAGWAPYTDGHWAYVAPWGWTWIDDAPWGFAPFHYGRWAYIGGRWAWCPHEPGIVVARPVYAPALVAFIGGNGFGISISVGGPMAAVGWVPLAPNEIYHPWYRASRGYLHQVNVFNVNRTVINNVTVVRRDVTVERYANRNAAVVVPAQAFTHAAPVRQARVEVPRDQLERQRIASRIGMSAFQATAAARAARAQPNAVHPQPANARAQIASQPVAYHAAPAAPAEATHAPGPRFAKPATQGRQVPRENAAVTTTPRPQPKAAAPAPQAQPKPAVAEPHPVAHPPAVRQPERPAAQPAAPRPAARTEAPRVTPQAAPAQSRTLAQPRPAVRQARPQMQVQHPVQQMHLAPTSQGWRRQPAAPHAAPAHAAPTERKKDEH